MSSHITTPFGARSLTLGQVAAQMNAREVPEGTIAHKWHVYRTITRAKSRLGLSDRTLAVLNALLSFRREDTLDGDMPVVFPSNKQLSFRTHGMADATLRRHLAALVKAGLIIRRDSPNGKRFVRKGEGGDFGEAFGFDLSPLVSRAQEFVRLADEVEAEERAFAHVRRQVSLYRRDITKMIALGRAEELQADWRGLAETFAMICAAIPRTPTREYLELVLKELTPLAQSIQKILENAIKTQKMNGTAAHFERHIIQNSKIESLNEIEPCIQECEGGKGENLLEGEVPEERKLRSYPLGMVLEACPEIQLYSRGGAAITSWGEFLTVAELVRSMLGISPDAWAQAIEVMGRTEAAVVVAAILERCDEIKQPGGYLRALTNKAREGQFGLGPVLMALMGRKAKKKAEVAKMTPQ